MRTLRLVAVVEQGVVEDLADPEDDDNADDTILQSQRQRLGRAGEERNYPPGENQQADLIADAAHDSVFGYSVFGVRTEVPKTEDRRPKMYATISSSVAQEIP